MMMSVSLRRLFRYDGVSDRSREYNALFTSHVV